MPASKTSRIGHLPAVVIATVVGFSLAYVLNFRETKKQARLQELTLLIYGNCYHIHHFIVFGILIVAMAAGRALPERALVALMAFFVGISAEDLLFKDWFLIKNNCHKLQAIHLLRNTTDVNPRYNYPRDQVHGEI